MTDNNAIYIPQPLIKVTPTSPLPVHLQFCDLAKSTKPQLIGKVYNSSLFSQPLPQQVDGGEHNHYIKAPGTGFYIPPHLEQFKPTFSEMMNHYYAQGGTDGYCYIGVIQKTIEPHPTDQRSFIKGHRDFDAVKMVEQGSTQNWHSYVVSDALMTGFSTYDFTDGDVERIRKADNPNDEQRIILDGKPIKFEGFNPYAIVKFDSATPHAHANPIEPTKRTFLIASFVPPDAVIEYGFNNPWLENAIKLKTPEANDFKP